MSSTTTPPAPGSTVAVFATNVRVHLARRDWSHADLAARLEPAQSAAWVRRRLDGENGTTLTDLDRIAAVLGTTSAELITPDRNDRPAYFPGGEA